MSLRPGELGPEERHRHTAAELERAAELSRRLEREGRGGRVSTATTAVQAPPERADLMGGGAGAARV